MHRGTKKGGVNLLSCFSQWIFNFLTNCVSWVRFSTELVTCSAVWTPGTELDLHMVVLTHSLMQTAEADVSIHVWTAQINHTLTLHWVFVCNRPRTIPECEEFVIVIRSCCRWHHRCRRLSLGLEQEGIYLTHHNMALCSLVCGCFVVFLK